MQFLILAPGPLGREELNGLASLCLPYVGKSARGRELASPAGLPTKPSYFSNDTAR